MEDPDVRVLVRTYRHHAEERLAATDSDLVLGQVLSKSEPSLDDILSPWRVLYEPWIEKAEENPITKVLSIEAGKLQDRWHLFRQTTLKDEQVDIKTLEPSITGAIQVIKEMSRTWDAKKWMGKRGKAKSYFHRLCGTLDAHSNLLEVVPRGSEYVSILAGTLTTIIRASVNHEAVAEDLTQAFCEISDVITGCRTDLKLFKTEDMQHAVADLYAHIFLFLNDAMCWYTKTSRRRLLDSFNEKFRDTFKDSVTNIQNKAALIQRRAAQGSAAELRVVRLELEGIKKDIRVGLEGQSRKEADVRLLEQQLQEYTMIQDAEWRKQNLNMERLQQALDTLLRDIATGHLSDWQKREDARRTKALTTPNLVTTDTQSNKPSSQYTIAREKLLLYSAGMENYFHRDRLRLNPPDLGSIYVDPQMVFQISEWTKSSTIQILAIAGPLYEGDELENPMTMLSARVVDSAANSGVPIISYFCELRRREDLIGGNTKEEQGLIQMVYALIRQMLELMLPGMYHDEDFNWPSFSGLDGMIDSWEETMHVFSNVQNLLPGTVLCVIDGLQWLDSRVMNKTELLVMEDRPRVGTEAWEF
ncbi:hypothetical protein OPT61_g698 [Boeremia exigua]|uniref:Uncharacterized protein n=1 Tax=Boeremia exigua TaxID=749465 RepID=A0ACC2ITE0_9PLEO|nr:hypothetical protein OPT61_g698 [Boeremia exigua]